MCQAAAAAGKGSGSALQPASRTGVRDRSGSGAGAGLPQRRCNIYTRRGVVKAVDEVSLKTSFVPEQYKSAPKNLPPYEIPARH